MKKLSVLIVAGLISSVPAFTFSAPLEAAESKPKTKKVCEAQDRAIGRMRKPVCRTETQVRVAPAKKKPASVAAPVSTTTVAATPEAKPKKSKKVCKVENSAVGRMRKTVCRVEDETELASFPHAEPGLKIETIE